MAVVAQPSVKDTRRFVEVTRQCRDGRPFAVADSDGAGRRAVVSVTAGADTEVVKMAMASEVVVDS